MISVCTLLPNSRRARSRTARTTELAPQPMPMMTKQTAATVDVESVCLTEMLEVVGSIVVELNVALSKTSDELLMVDQNSTASMLIAFVRCGSCVKSFSIVI